MANYPQLADNSGSHDHHNLSLNYVLFLQGNAVSKKIRGLRTQYVREKNKMKTRKGGDDPYITKWSYFERLKFLDDHITARSSHFKV